MPEMSVLCAACPHRCPHGNVSIEATPKVGVSAVSQTPDGAWLVDDLNVLFDSCRESGPESSAASAQLMAFAASSAPSSSEASG
jgi:hypothetical protein